MAIDLYNIGARVRYGEFVKAVGALVQSTLPAGYMVKLTAAGGKTASVRILRGHVSNHVTLNMPSYSMDRIVSAKWAKTLLGYVIHETAHVHYSDTQLYANMNRHGDRDGMLFLNVGEDYFIENRATHPGAELVANAGQLLGVLNEDGLAQQLAFDAVPTRQAMQLVFACLNRHGTQQGNHVEQDAAARATPEVWAIVGPMLTRLDTGLGNSAAQCLAEQQARLDLMWNAWQQLRALDVKQQQQPKPEQQQQPKPEQGEGEQQQQGEGEQQQGEGQGEGQQPEQDDEPEDAGQQGNGKGKSMTPAEINTRHADQQAEAAPEMQSGDGVLAVREAQFDLAAFNGQPAYFAPGDLRFMPNNHVAAGATANGIDVAAVADVARRKLRSPDTSLKVNHLVTGRMDKRALPRAAMGNRNVFARKTVTEGVKTGVQIMIDLSGSMGYSMPYVIGVCAALVPALERAGVEVGVAGFSDEGSSIIGSGSKFIVRLKDRRERMSSVGKFLAKWGNLHAMNSTPMLVPARYAETTLAAFPVTRRVCIWLCDGSPDEPNHTVKDYLFRDGAKAEHFGIGWACNLDEVFGDAWVRADSPAGVAAAFKRLLS